MKKIVFIAIALAFIFSGCTQETQNKLSRTLQNFTGNDGVLDVYSGGKLMKRFIKIDKVSTAYGTDASEARPYRYGYGYLDLNENYKVDDNEKKMYFEFSDYSTEYIFYENPTK